MAGELSDERLMALADGDPSAFAALYRRYERPLLAYFVRRTRDPELAADLTAEVFAAALAGLRSYRAGEGSVHAWLFGIAEHKLISSLRRRRVADRARRRLGMASIVLTDDDLERIERIAEGVPLAALLEEMPADQREAVRARILEERDYGDIARELRCSPAVVRKRVSRGLATLRQQMSKGEA